MLARRLARAPTTGAGAGAGGRRGLVVLSSSRCRLAPARSSSSSSSAAAAGEIADPERARHLQELRDLFFTFDTDGNGTIDRAELKRLLNTVDQGASVLLAFESFLTDSDVEAAFTAYDADNSDALDFDEFTRMVEDGLLLSEPLAEYEALFRKADLSGNGALGAAEIKGLLKIMGRDFSDDKIVDVFSEYDLNGSGQLELKEFLRMCARRLLDVKALREWMRGEEQREDGKESAGARSVAALLPPGGEGVVDVIFSAEELEEALNASAAEGGVVCVMCGLTWCRPCKGVAPAFAKLAEKYGGKKGGDKGGGDNGGNGKAKLKALKLYGNANDRTKAVFKRLKIRSTPAFVFFKGGEIAGAFAGSNKGRLETAIREVLGDEGVQGEERLYPPGNAITGGSVLTSGSE